MTHLPDDAQPPEEGRERPEGSPKLDEDAAWREIIANYGPEPPDVLPVEPVPPAEPAPSGDSGLSVLEPFDTPGDSLNSAASWDDEGHFVPPPPPPLPKIEPRRKLAWIALFATPALLILGAVFRVVFPAWVGLLMALGFIGGFVYLVATMSRKRHDDWPGDDGAVI